MNYNPSTPVRVQSCKSLALQISSYGTLTAVYMKFFETERVSELGHSVENHFFGGTLDHLVGRREDVKFSHPEPSWPAMGVVLSTYPSWRKVENILAGEEGCDSDRRRGKNVDIQSTKRVYDVNEFEDDQSPDGYKAYYDIWPVPIRWIQNFQQFDFWETSIRSGKHNFKVPQILGKRQWRNRSALIVGKDYKDCTMSVASTEFPGQPLGHTDVTAESLNDLATIRRYAVRTALRNEADAKQIARWKRDPLKWKHFPLGPTSPPGS